jgi:hypothetical protein
MKRIQFYQNSFLPSSTRVFLSCARTCLLFLNSFGVRLYQSDNNSFSLFSRRHRHSSRSLPVLPGLSISVRSPSFTASLRNSSQTQCSLATQPFRLLFSSLGFMQGKLTAQRVKHAHFRPSRVPTARSGAARLCARLSSLDFGLAAFAHPFAA